MNFRCCLLALCSILFFVSSSFAQVASYIMPRMEHCFEGLVADAFMSDDGSLLWTCEDGGRVRFRDSAGIWNYLDTPDQTQDTIRAIHFCPHPTTGWSIPGNLVGWIVGDNRWIMKTPDGGATWTDAGSNPTDPVQTTYTSHIKDVFFIRVPTSVASSGFLGWLVGLHGVWKSVDEGASWTAVTLLDQAGAPFDLADLELYAIDVLQCGTSEPRIAVCGEPGVVFRNVLTSTPSTWGDVMEVSWDIRDHAQDGSLDNCGSTSLSESIRRDNKYQPWDIEFQRKCDGDPLLIMVGDGGAAFSSTDYGANFTRECHECEVYPTLCANNTDYEPGTSHAHYNRHKQFMHLYGVGVFGDGSAVAGGYNGQHVVRGTDGVWVDRSQHGSWTLEVPPDAALMTFNGAVSQRNAGSSSTNGHAFMGGQGGQGRGTTAAAATPTPPPGQPAENWTGELPSGWWRMEATAFNLPNRGWRTGQQYHVAMTLDGGRTWVLENVLPFGYANFFNSIAVSPSADQMSGSGVAVGLNDGRAYTGTGTFGCSPSWQFLPKILRRVWDPNQMRQDWVEPTSITPATGLKYQDLHDVVWADTVTSGDVYWACGTAESVIHSVDGGDNWIQATMPTGSATNTFVSLAFINKSDGVFVGVNSTTSSPKAFGVHATASGYTWTDISPTTSGALGLLDVALSGTKAYAVGSVVIPGVGLTGTVFESTFNGTAFSTFSPLSSQPGASPCSIGDARGWPPLNNIAVASNGDLWVGGECGRIWCFSTLNGWKEVKSQTDGHIKDLASTPGGDIYATSARANLTGPGLVRWNPGSQ